MQKNNYLCAEFLMLLDVSAWDYKLFYGIYGLALYENGVPPDYIQPRTHHCTMNAPKPDEPAWYPMMATYGRAKAMKLLLDERQVRNFVPMRYESVMRRNGERSYESMPILSSLVFIYESKNRLVTLKREPGFLPLQFYTRPQPGNHEVRDIIYVPDRQMDNFMRVCSADDDRVVLLEDSDYLAAQGKRVVIKEGPLAGIEGVIKRIKKDKCVIVRIEGVACAGILHFPAKNLLVLNDGE